MRIFSMSPILAGFLFTMGNGSALAHDEIDIVTQARTHLRLVLATFGGETLGKPTRSLRRLAFRKQKTSLERIIAKASHRYGIRKSFIRAVIKCESNFDSMAVSNKGAIGLMQIMPATAWEFGVEPDGLFDPEISLNTGTRYIRVLALRYDGRLEAVAAAYNAGPGRYESRRRLPAETRKYVRCVKRNYLRYSRSGEGAR